MSLLDCPRVYCEFNDNFLTSVSNRSINNNDKQNYFQKDYY